MSKFGEIQWLQISIPLAGSLQWLAIQTLFFFSFLKQAYSFSCKTQSGEETQETGLWGEIQKREFKTRKIEIKIGYSENMYCKWLLIAD